MVPSIYHQKVSKVDFDNANKILQEVSDSAKKSSGCFNLNSNLPSFALTIFAKHAQLAGITKNLDNSEPINVSILSVYKDVKKLSSDAEDKFTQAVQTYNDYLQQS